MSFKDPSSRISSTTFEWVTLDRAIAVSMHIDTCRPDPCDPITLLEKSRPLLLDIKLFLEDPGSAHVGELSKVEVLLYVSSEFQYLAN